MILLSGGLRNDFYFKRAFMYLDNCYCIMFFSEVIYKMKILFLNSNTKYGDYITDALMYGLILEGHDVLDFPKRQQCYKDCPPNYFSTRGFWHYGWIKEDINKDKRNILGESFKEFDLVICDNASLYSENFNKNIICLLTNDPITRAPMPNIRIDKSMGIKEKCLQSEEVNDNNYNDFPLNHTVLKEDCHFVPIDKRSEEVFMSMSIYGDVRKEFAHHFENKKFANKDDYFNAIRKAKYGISIYGEGYNCQRDPELGGNTLLCKYKHPKWVYDETSYRDGVNCIEFSSYDELMKKIEYFNSHPEEYNKLLKACYIHTIKYYTMDGQARRLLEWKMKK